MCHITLLSLNFLNSSPGHESGIRLLYGRHEKRGVGEQVIHFLEWVFDSFRKDDPEEYSVYQVINLTFTVSEGNDTFWRGRHVKDELTYLTTHPPTPVIRPP
jgi:hypothetical protein